MKPILFNGEMTRAILEGRKTQTRRLVKPQPKDKALLEFRDGILSWGDMEAGTCYEYEAKAAYQPGDILYVRETWAKISDWATVDPPVGIPDGFIYRAEWPDGEDGPKWRPSIHMPRKAARIFLRVTDVRVERLWDIQPADICAEGVPIGANDSADMAYESFSVLWNSTIKPSDLDCFGWDANPWVFVYTFERCEKEDSE